MYPMDPFKQACRFCLYEENLLIDCSLHDGAVQAKISTVFSFPFSSSLSLPSRICNGCYLKIDEYYEFTEKVRQNQEQLTAHEVLTFPVNIKLETSDEEFLEKPIVVKEPFLNCHQTTNIKTEVTSDEAVCESNEAKLVSYDSNQCIVQSQDEMVQFKIEFEDTEVQRGCEPSMERAKKTTKERAEEDRLIKHFFSLICETCSTQFDSFARLKQHTRITHNKKLSFTCCNKKYSRRFELLDHIALHSNPHHFQCNLCDKTYRRKNGLENHRLIAHIGEDGRPFKCDQCMRSFPKRYMLTFHMTKHVPMECDICHKMLSDSGSLRNHKTRVHSKANKHICDICGIELSSKHALYRHKMQLHESTSPVAQVEVQVEDTTEGIPRDTHLRSRSAW